MTALLVVAHPDDEVLALGGAAPLLAAAGPLHTCILSATADMRLNRPADDQLYGDLRQAHALVGMQASYLGAFPNLSMNTVPHIELVRFIEQAIEDCGAQYIYTHHPEDLNDDHRHTSLACQAAVRLFQRRMNIPCLRGFYFIEVPSSTEWSFAAAGKVFQPTGFFEIGEQGLEKKIQAVQCYRGVMRDYPHPRSAEAIRALAARRGSQAGVHYAEAVQVVFQRLDL